MLTGDRACKGAACAYSACTFWTQPACGSFIPLCSWSGQVLTDDLQFRTAQELKEELRRTESKMEANAKVRPRNLCTFGTRPAQLVACVAATHN